MTSRKKIASNERGQASLMIGMMMMTFILLFAFVVNTGMLVNAKINLQNAADLAAYAGAAVQARQLNDISYLNYEMRRQYKKFLYRYYVIGNMASAWFPGTGSNSSNCSNGGAPCWGPGGSSSSFNYEVPSVCVAFSSTGKLDDYCQVGTLQGIIIPPDNNPLAVLDQINQTLITELSAIENLRQNNCGKIATANTTLLMLWLFNTSPDLQSLRQALTSLGNNGTDQDEAAILQISANAAYGLGLVPRELILNQRIKTLESYVNEPPQKNVTISAVNALTGQPDPASYERTIQAFLSAYDTLGNHTFGDNTQITMTELLPGDTDQATLLQLNPLMASFDTYAVGFTTVANPNSPNSNSMNCQPVLTPVTVAQIPLGVAKDTSTLTFYALRLQAEAQVLFSPFGNMQLTAYAAARPFGSRIGPQSATFTMPGEPNPQLLLPNAPKPVGQLPNLPITQQDEQGLAAGKGWDNSSVLGTMYSQLFGGAPPAQGEALGSTNFQNGFAAAMVPNPVEGTIYNIPAPNTLLPDPFVTNFDSLDQMSFWAPIISPARISKLSDVLTQAFQQALSQSSASGKQITNPIVDPNATANLSQAMAANLVQYVQSLESGEGEILAGAPDASGRCNSGSCVQEGVNIAHIQDPFEYSGKPLQLGSSIMIPTTVSAVKTSYVNTNDPQGIEPLGRVGYSVKFVSFDSLTKTGTDVDGSGTTVKPQGFLDSQAQKDTLQIQH